MPGHFLLFQELKCYLHFKRYHYQHPREAEEVIFRIWRCYLRFSAIHPAQLARLNMESLYCLQSCVAASYGLPFINCD
ncbi:hypothetical protein Nepgr_001169 [Nepenthes gracilis]|uniref:Uncharacterized protein n=1 Tax=Nepenthes gracilis TaxID=150966 RepID=A0AAD3RXJ3_NEPGR|nr:hypothetical protein Nepgr_001169 [Nepenthes gracilis]